MKSDLNKHFAQCLYERSKIPEPFKIKQEVLPAVYELYLDYYKNYCLRQKTVEGARRILSDLNIYLQKSNISLHKISIEQIDHFIALYNKNYALGTCRWHRSYLRGFLKYLYQKGYITKNFASMVIGPPEFARSTPPKFLRTEEIQKLFNSLNLSIIRDLRTYAMLHLAYYLGLRPREISLITFDDISFRQKEISIKSRKTNSPTKLPLPENTIKAIIVYIVGGRPVSDHRRLFLQLIPPYKPIVSNDITRYIGICMQKNNLCASAYWLRHSYAQNLLESGASIYEIKEMMGHNNIESTRTYLSVHINLMRKVIIDETL
ncbi:MAG: tyrosine-type recombinase/integrase [Desulfobacteraceae bacterium]|nr:tyrosine-type recombinase/integrase [Desulfobacteraceae bacterium]